MKSTILKIDKYHQTKQGKIAFGVVELLLSYAVISLAIDSGSLWHYVIGILLLIGGANNLINAVTGRIKSHAKNRLKKR